ncbi:ATP/GTP-binding protein (plasmid) [Streptoverticillium reticulum]|uniref:ATP/GTP-binding protein n=1 Tax=Streptoverticillium reticulum TaxID=1433415 RepID=UPI0039BEE555
MAGRDLRALFSTNDHTLAAAEAFTNRQLQWQTVGAALAEHLEHISDTGFDVQDLEAPRDNVVNLYGIGGIGKTTFSRVLEAALTSSENRPAQWGELALPHTRLLPVRIDLARSGGTDFERIILSIRLALAGLGRPLPAFDIALRRYWDATHPGEPLDEYLRRGRLAKLAKGLPQQMQSALGEVAGALALPGLVGAAAGQVTTTLVRALRERRQTVKALAGCHRLADLLEADPDIDTLSYYAHLLAWELSQLPKKKQVVPVILLDTFEDIADPRRDFERLIQRLVWLMPTALFVITGRNRLPWGDAALNGQLDYTGPTSWPGLADHAAARTATGSGGRRQLLIGDFSPEDCGTYLARRLTRDDEPLISEDIRDVITRSSHGLPLHLDLAVMRFLEIRRTRTPEPGDFTHPFPALVARTLSDLPSEERHVARAVSLLDAFDETLAARAAGLPHQAPVRRLLERPFVREDAFALWPFHLHGVIRAAIRSADDQTDDRWTPTDWQQAAQRALTALGEQWTSQPGPGRALLVACLRQGLRLARDHHLDLGWLTEAAWAYVADFVWEPVAPPAADEPTDAGIQTAADALVELLSALARRQREHRARTAERLTAVLETGLLPGDLTEMALYYRAKADRDLGHTAASRDGMQRVAEAGGRLAPDARRGLVHLARMAGDFPTALDAAQALGEEGRQHRVLGDIWWPQGDLPRAAAAYEAARAQAEEHSLAGERAIAQAQRAFVAAFTDPAQADDEITLARQLLDGLDLRATALTIEIAALLRDAGTTGVEDRAQVLRTEIDIAGLPTVQTTLELALAFHHAVLDAHDDLAATLSRLGDLTRNGDYAYYNELIHFMAGLPLPGPAATRWISGEQAVRDRWHRLVHDRRSHLSR